MLLAGRLARGAPPWFALAYGVLAGSAYLTHPRGLVVTGAAVVVGLRRAPPAGPVLRAGLLVVPAARGLAVATPAISRWATDSTDFKSETLLRAALDDVPHVLASMGGHLSTSPPQRTASAARRLRAGLPGAARGRPVRARCRSRWRRWPPPPGCSSWPGSFWHAPFRSDQMIYGRYNEATLLPILAAGVLALVTAPLDRRRIVVMLAPIALLWTIPYLAWDAALRSTRAGELQHPRRRAGRRPRPRRAPARDRARARPRGGGADRRSPAGRPGARLPVALRRPDRCSVGARPRDEAGLFRTARATARASSCVGAQLLAAERARAAGAALRVLRPEHRRRVLRVELPLPRRWLAVRPARRGDLSRLVPTRIPRRAPLVQGASGGDGGRTSERLGSTLNRALDTARARSRSPSRRPGCSGPLASAGGFAPVSPPRSAFTPPSPNSPSRRATTPSVRARICRSSVERPVLDVPDVEHDPLLPADPVAPVDLRPAGQPGPHPSRRRWTRRSAPPGRRARGAGRPATSRRAATLISCGSSSSDQSRRSCPMRVIRSSPRRDVQPEPDAVGVDHHRAELPDLERRPVLRRRAAGGEDRPSVSLLLDAPRDQPDQGRQQPRAPRPPATRSARCSECLSRSAAGRARPELIGPAAPLSPGSDPENASCGVSPGTARRTEGAGSRAGALSCAHQDTKGARSVTRRGPILVPTRTGAGRPP